MPLQQPPLEQPLLGLGEEFTEPLQQPPLEQPLLGLGEEFTEHQQKEIFHEDYDTFSKEQRRALLLGNVKDIMTFEGINKEEFLSKVLYWSHQLGTLKKHLCALQLPLNRYHRVASENCGAALTFLNARNREGFEKFTAELGKELKKKDKWSPSPDANLLANFLSVPGTTPKKFLEGAFRQKIIQASDQYQERPGTEARGSANVFGAVSDFPKHLNVLYIDSVVKREDIYPYPGEDFSDCMYFDGMLSLQRLPREEKERLQEEVKKMHTREGCLTAAAPAGAQGGDSSTWAEKIEQMGLIRTSPLSDVTLREGERRSAALIPINAQNFAFVYPCKQMDLGGFLYADSEGKLLAVNALTQNTTRTAFVFSRQEQFASDIQAETVRLLETAFEIKGTGWAKNTEYVDSGFSHICWVGPGEKKPFHGHAHGCLAFLSESSPSKNCFYDVTGAKPVWNRAALVGKQQIALVKVPSSGKGGGEWDGVLIRNKFLEKQNLAFETRPVRINLFNVQGVMHPVVLHRLAFPPELEALKTEAAKAIVDQGYPDRTMKFMAVLQMFRIFAVLFFSRYLREEFHMEKGFKIFTCLDSPQAFTLILWVALSVWLFQVSRASLLLWSFHCRGWWQEYLSEQSRYAMWVGLIVEILILLSLKSARTAPATHLGLAIVGISAWWMLVQIACGQTLSSLKVGARTSPIYEAMKDTAPFLVVIFFFFGACFTVSYSITSLKMTELYEMIFEMTFTGQYNPLVFDDNTTFLKSEDDTEQFVEWSGRFGLSIIFVITIMVVVNNLFISLVGEAYMKHSNVAKAHVRVHRAREALEWLLLKPMFEPVMIYFKQHDRYEEGYDPRMLWVCCADQAE